MSSQIAYDNNPTVVAIDKDKNSTYAVKWAIDNLVVTNKTIILIHIRIKNSQTQTEVDFGVIDDIFLPYRTFCARKGITIQDVVLEGIDVHSVLLDYINNNKVTNIVLGASSRNPFLRFWTPDVPTLISKSAPDFCSVYVIARGKPQSINSSSARRAATPNLLSPEGSVKLNHLLSPEGSVKLNHFEVEDETKREKKKAVIEAVRLEKMMNSGSVSQRNETSNRWSKNTTSCKALDNALMDCAFYLDSMDITQVDIPKKANVGQSDELDGKLSHNEVLRLKQEVKQTMDMYNTACKQAISAQQRVDELQQIKVDETNRVERARLAEEAALKLMEMEKAKCRAAIEAAETAQKIAEREMQKRKFAEMKAKREAQEKNRALDVLSSNDVRYRKYSMDEIRLATDDFSRSMKIGEGGYGPVFKGRLDHTPVAIKLLRTDAAHGRKQFQQEVEVLSCMRHPNMVLLMGACPEYGCLVYEFMNNGSLEDRLYRKGKTPPIPWGVRFKIASDIATGLLFLHQAKPEPLVHRDLKPGNILLNHHYTCKISDVGLARLVPPSVADSVTQYHMTSAAGTFCYIDPEYQKTGELGTKSDIYSLGVMLLQIITGRPPMGLTHHVDRAIENGTFVDLLDPTVPDWPVEEARSFARLALKCAELKKKDRPDLGKDVLPELNRLKELGIEHGLGHWHSSHGSSP